MPNPKAPCTRIRDLTNITLMSNDALCAERTSTEREDMIDNYIPATVSIDGDYLSHLPCLVLADQRWNGWAIPFFPLASAERIVRGVESDDCTRIYWDGDTVVLISNPDHPTEEYTDPIDAIVIDGIRYWPIGAWSWTWSIDPAPYVDIDPGHGGWSALIGRNGGEWHGDTVLDAWDAMTEDQSV